MDLASGKKISGTFRASPQRLSDVGLIHRFLRDLVETIGMTALGYHVYDVPLALKRMGEDPIHDEGGVTGLAVLSTSHLAIHTWPEEGGARIDVDSCRDFEAELVTITLREYFQASSIDLHDLSFSFNRSSVDAAE